MAGFKPMLAETAELSDFKFPLYASVKLDGIRCLIRDGMAYSRKLKPIPNEFVQWCIGRHAFNGLDGELIVGDPTSKTAFNTTTRGVMKTAGKPDFKFYVFEDCGGDLPYFEDRLIRLKQVSEWQDQPMIELLDQELCLTMEELLAYEEVALSSGYEGLITRSPNSPYKLGRSTAREGYMLKLKRFLDSEALIIGWQEGMTNNNVAEVDALGHTKRSTSKAGKISNGTLGSLLCRDLKTGVEFSCAGGTVEDGSNLWAIRDQLVGKIAKYKYFPVGVKDKPRFPIFLGLRHEDDL